VLEVEGDPDSWVPPVSGGLKKEKGKEAAGLRWAASGTGPRRGWLDRFLLFFFCKTF
jgi:hypothetical protein